MSTVEASSNAYQTQQANPRLSRRVSAFTTVFDSHIANWRFSTVRIKVDTSFMSFDVITSYYLFPFFCLMVKRDVLSTKIHIFFLTAVTDGI